MKNLLIDLPEDLLINNILLSKVLPIKSLSILRCVCKYLNNLIASPTFRKLHLHHSTSSTSPPPNHQQLNNQLVLIDFCDVFYSLKFNDGVGGDPCRPEVIRFHYLSMSPKIWGSCNGLLCLRDVDGRVCLWNPLTKEYKDVPPPLPLQKLIMGSIAYRFIISTTNYGFGYDRFIDDYKIIRCEHIVKKFYDGTTDGHLIPLTEFQVYTLGTNTWRKISSDNNPYKSYYDKPVNPMQFANGAFHMIMSKSNWFKWKKSSEVKIVTFDIEKEVLGEMQWPLLSKLDYCSTSEIQVLRGCLCVSEFDEKEKCCNVWMMMDYDVNESWTKLFTIDLNKVRYLCNNLLSGYRLLRFCENGEILIGSYKVLFTYDPIKNKARRVELGETGNKLVLRSEKIYIESLVSLNSGVYKGY